MDIKNQIIDPEKTLPELAAEAKRLGRYIDLFSIKFCLCWAEEGFTHSPLCPFPYYGNDQEMVAKWMKERVELIGRLADKLQEGVE